MGLFYLFKYYAFILEDIEQGLADRNDKMQLSSWNPQTGNILSEPLSEADGESFQSLLLCLCSVHYYVSAGNVV